MIYLVEPTGQRTPGLAKHVWHVLFQINVYSDATDAGAMRSGMLFRPDNHWSVIDVIRRGLGQRKKWKPQNNDRIATQRYLSTLPLHVIWMKWRRLVAGVQESHDDWTVAG